MVHLWRKRPSSPPRLLHASVVSRFKQESVGGEGRVAEGVSRPLAAVGAKVPARRGLGSSGSRPGRCLRTAYGSLGAADIARPTATVGEVNPRAPEDPIVSGAAAQAVVAAVTGRHVGAGTAHDAVVAVVAGHVVAAPASMDDVIAAETADAVVALMAQQHVGVM